ncbi:cell wall metabolism sensor histidine kinase WalK [Terribacillus saccharophilus]|uniref:histidine kinase n=1 Tax=Terribacillus saccharophilus TaxID=361277 RepID=A0A268A760_9BACI|nr:cell wall metabolism sensor histidine kinase WalK [Terribacillus saccharophilus]PAD19956.1 cell wall metabolism sensor histidine kinase WalK [Terribacillus saccharophilus]PAF17196.1 cell wall metabolism sensor histidine kinase WalK [Terribacillus saccharophilus]PAF20501.1 cell wall metabolism sensor histidine kinase WalK [Terribacillus saccharophilus]PAF35395.1 cell wall metabolism sensor histidine kinase WalK [Terribacillus saccharophilus]PAF39030.1 cell wall metabolism sensor histidine ki
MNKIGFFRSVSLKLVVVYILLLIIALLLIGVFFTNSLENQLIKNTQTSLTSNMEWLEQSLVQEFEDERSPTDPTLEEDIADLLENYSEGEETKIQVIDTQRQLVGTSELGDQNSVGARVTDNNIIQAITNNGFPSTEKTNIVIDRDSGDRTLKSFYNIMGTDSNGESELLGLIYVRTSIEPVYSQLKSTNIIFLQATFIALIFAAILGILIARAITKPIKEMQKQARVMATGDFSKRVNVYGEDEIGQLARTFNHMNDELRQAHMRTEGERRKLSSVLSHMSDGVIATDRNGAITLMNAPAESLIGRSADEVRGQFLIEVLNLNEKIVDITEIQETGSIIIDMSDDDQYLLLRCNFSIVQDEYEQISGFITVISDVTEQEQIDQERREFVSNVSHELRTPLTTMRSYLEALTDGAWKDESIAPHFLDVTQQETDRMIRLVNDLLQLSRMDSSNYTMEWDRINFVDFFHHVIDRFEMNKREDIHFERYLPKEEALATIDKDKIMQVLDNVISNAIKYSPDGGTIRFRVRKDSQKLLVSISDEGMGIAYEKLDKIFERFYRTDKARTRKLGGTGLGLAIAKDLIEAHHGVIWAESKEGRGTTVLFTIPLNRKRGEVR